MAKAWEVPGLERDVSFREAAGRIILTRWNEMMSYRDGTLVGVEIEYLHAMRVSSRRLRSALDAFAPAFPKRSFRRHLTTVKSITETLGAARDLDVAAAGLVEIVEEFAPDEQPGVLALIDDARARRTAEEPEIAALFQRLDDEGYDRRFQRWVTKHTAVDHQGFAAGADGD